MINTKISLNYKQYKVMVWMFDKEDKCALIILQKVSMLKPIKTVTKLNM